MCDRTIPIDITTIRYIDINDYRVRTAKSQTGGGQYAAYVVGDGIEEFDDAPVTTATESRYIAAAFAVDAYEETR